MARVPGPLSHLTVLDLSRVLAGPWCTQLLGDLGATIIKIERPRGGDDTRAWGPPYLRDREGSETSEAAYYLVLQSREAVGRRRLHDAGRPADRARSRAAVRRADRELQGRRARALRSRLRQRRGRQRVDRLCVDHRLRPGRPVRRSRRLRLHHPGDERLHERHRRARRRAGRRSAEGRRRDHRPDDRHVRGGRHPRRDRASRAHRRRPAHRSRAARFGGRDDVGDEP